MLQSILQEGRSPPYSMANRSASAGEKTKTFRGHASTMPTVANLLRRTDAAANAPALVHPQRGRDGFPGNKREGGAGYLCDKRLGHTATLVFQNPPWATDSAAEHLKGAVQRSYSHGQVRSAPNVASNGFLPKDGVRIVSRGTCSREAPPRRELNNGMGFRRNVLQRSTVCPPAVKSDQPIDSVAGRNIEAVKGAARPIPYRNEKTSFAVVAVDSNLQNRSYMEDGHKIIDQLYAGNGQQWSMYAVYDGHGGRVVTDKCLQLMHEIVLAELVALPDFPTPEPNNVRRALEKSFVAMDEAISKKEAWNCGATCTVTLIHASGGSTRKLYVANVGDSRCVLISGDKAIRSSFDHRASDPEEIVRVQSLGGVISRGRVGGQLMLTRALGDFSLKKCGVTCLPFTKCHLLKPCDFVIIASDGLWDVLSDVEAGRMCLAARQKDGNESIVAKMLVDTAMTRGSTDNITCVVVFT